MAMVDEGIELLKRKIGFDRLYDGIEPCEAARHFFNGADIFDALIASMRPRMIVEVGSWMGHSAIHMSRAASALHDDALVICVDTWLGSSEHYFDDTYLADLALKNGRPDFYIGFLANVLSQGRQHGILPLSISSHAGFEILQKLGVKADLVYIDAGHGYDDVRGDLRAFAKLLAPGGVIFGDDYFHAPVKRAVDGYARNHDLHIASYGDRGHKWILVESQQAAERLLPGLPIMSFV